MVKLQKKQTKYGKIPNKGTSEYRSAQTTLVLMQNLSHFQAYSNIGSWSDNHDVLLRHHRIEEKQFFNQPFSF